MEEENNRELVFVGTLLKLKNGKISVLVYKKLPYMYPDKLLHYSSHDQKVAWNVLYAPCLTEHIPLSAVKMS